MLKYLSLDAKKILLLVQGYADLIIKSLFAKVISQTTTIFLELRMLGSIFKGAVQI